MTAQVHEADEALSETVRKNIRAEAARRGWDQGRMAAIMGVDRSAISNRYTGRTAWSLDETQRAAQAFGLPIAELYAMRDLNPQPADLEHWDGTVPPSRRLTLLQTVNPTLTPNRRTRGHHPSCPSRQGSGPCIGCGRHLSAVAS